MDEEKNTEEKKKLNVNFELREQTSNNNVSTSDKSNDILDKSEKRKSKERKHKKKSKESKGNKRELPLPNINNTEVDGKNDE